MPMKAVPLSKLAPGAPKKGRKVVSVSITRAQNGFTTATDYEQPKDKGKTVPHWEPPEVNVHESIESVVELVKKRLGGK